MVSCNKNKSTGSSSSSDEQEIVVPGKDINFTVSFYFLPTDTEPYATLTVKSGNKIKASDIPTNPERNGYKFGGWYKTTSFSPGDEFNQNSVIGKDIKLYAYWIAPFTITFYEDLYDGVVNKTITRFSDQTIDQSEIYTPEKTNYEFGGWYEDENCSTPYVFDEHLTRNIVLYAKWNSTSAKLYYVTNTKKIRIPDEKHDKETEFDLTIPNNIDGAIFIAWCKDRELTQIINDSKFIIYEDTTIYAKWEFNHNHSYEIAMTIIRDATCTEDGSIAYCCSTCGYYENEETISALGHNKYEGEYYNGGTYHYHKCLRCGEELDKKAHTFNEGEISIPATCTEIGEKTYSCTICSATKKEEISALGHNPDNNNWTSDETNHWHACLNGCEEHFDEHEHHKVRDESKDHTSTSCAEPNVVGWKCSICNADLSDVSQAKPHNVVARVYESNDTQHWQVCTECHNDVNIENHAFTLDRDHSIAATCQHTGIDKYICSICGYEKEEIVPKKSHSLKWATNTTNCLTDEQKALCDIYHFRYCENCNRVFDESKEEHIIDWTDVRKPGHPGTITIREKSTCTTHGRADVTCKKCGQTHYDVEMPLLSHDWIQDTDLTIEATCLQDGQKHFTCQNCGETKIEIVKADHDYQIQSETPKSCTIDGSRVLKCTVCGDTKTEIIPAGHTFGNYTYNETHHWHICQNDSNLPGSCGNLSYDNGEHDFELVIQNTPTNCEDEVSVIHRCKICQYYYTETTTGIGHNWDNGTIIAEPSCTDPGYKEYTCLKCGKIHTETFGAPLGHNWNDGVVTTDPTCTATGVKTYTCTRCGTTRTEPVDALGHDWDEGTITQPPTCIVPGVKTYECKRCHLTRTETIPVIDHDWGEGEITLDSTCTATGIRTYTCSMCHDTRTEIIPMKPHTYADEPVINRYPTCTEEGERAFECTVCHQQITEPIPALGHSWNSGTQTTDPTCTQQGVMTYECTRCHITKTEPVDPLGHDYHDSVTAPTCTERGYTTHTCSRCGDNYKDTYVDALGHAWNDGVVTTDPTCTATGVKTYTCTRCSATRTESVPMVPHTYGTTWTYLDEDHDALQCQVCGQVKETRAHDYDGYCCKYCHHYLLQNYIEKFTTHGAQSDPIVIESEDEFIMFLDYILSNYITTSKFFKVGGDFATALNAQGKNLTLKKTYEDLIATYQSKVTMPVPSYSGAWYSGNYSMGIKWYLQIEGAEVNYNTYISTEGGEGYGTIYYDVGNTWYEDLEGANLPQQDYYFSDYSSSRTNSFDEFKYKEYTTEFNCATSDQVVYALEHYMKPVCTGRALSIVNRAKTILREIVDDDMSDYEKVKAIYKWIVSNVTYDNAVLDPNNLYDSTDDNGWVHFASWFAEGALDYGYAVCDGISKAFVILTGLEGIRSVRISSHAAAHAWNKVFIDTNADGVGEWYVVDATWGNLAITGTGIEIYDASHFLISDAQKTAQGCAGDNYTDIVATTTYNYYLTETFEYNSTTYDLYIENAAELQALKNYMQDNDSKTTTYKTISIFIVGTLEPTGMVVEGINATINGVNGKYYILIIS
ncbi:MAG: InlB B-repeat-containing protein [Clostridia bacterium]|nr:InlB B-repeat-containing protein [Clostridia bacterium]